jgi:hypothetical protein
MPLRAATACTPSSRDRRAEFFSPSIASAAWNRFPSLARFHIHADNCPRYAEDGGFPEELRDSPRTLEGYARGRRLVAQEFVTDGEFEPAIQNLFALPEIDYLQVHSTTAGCFTFRIERAAQSTGFPR